MSKITGDYVLTAQELSLVAGGESAGRCIAYTVVKGDSLPKIARTYGVDVRTLAQLNHIQDDNRIFVGQVLLIPLNTK